MAIYALTSLGSNLSALVTNIQAQQDSIRSLERGTVTPNVLVTGLLFNRTDRVVIGEAIERYNGSAWTLLLDPEHAQLNAGGTVVPTVNLPMGGFKITGLAPATANGDAARYEQVLHRNGALAATGTLNMGGQKISSLGAPIVNGDAARIQDCQPNNACLINRDENPTQELAADHAGSFQTGPESATGVREMPLMVAVRASGEVRFQSDNSLLGTLTLQNWLVFRHDETTIVVANLTLGVTPIRFAIEWKTSAPKGLWFSTFRVTDGAFLTVENLSLIMVAGVGE